MKTNGREKTPYPGKRACQTVRAVHNQPVYFGAGGCYQYDNCGGAHRIRRQVLEQARAEAAREAPR